MLFVFFLAGLRVPCVFSVLPLAVNESARLWLFPPACETKEIIYLLINQSINLRGRLKLFLAEPEVSQSRLVS